MSLKSSKRVLLALTLCGGMGLAKAAPLLLPALPPIDLGESLGGEPAIQALGSLLGAVAAHHGLSEERLADLLRRDSSLRVSEHGYLMFVEERSGRVDLKLDLGSEDRASESDPALDPALDLDQTFKLHSKPGSAAVIYLDFDGFQLGTGTSWNRGNFANIAPFRGVTNTGASDLAKERIQRIWQRVAEDFAPFDVDVTTEEPPLTHQVGTRVVITDQNESAIGLRPCCLGIANLQAFRYDDFRRQPGAWVFSRNIPSSDLEILVAEVISHEAGHTLGLFHDGAELSDFGNEYYPGHGSGPTGWAPIMGLGERQALSQWDRGEYPGANNSQDDLAVMEANGVARRPDDFGNTPATAASLASANAGGGHVVDQRGLIERDSDADVFSFVAGAGELELTVTPAERGPNLDLAVSLLADDGSVLARSSGLLGVGTALRLTLGEPRVSTVATANDPDDIDADLSARAESRRYFLKVEGAGDADPAPGYSGYGSLGRYRITGRYPEARTYLKFV